MHHRTRSRNILTTLVLLLMVGLLGACSSGAPESDMADAPAGDYDVPAEEAGGGAPQEEGSDPEEGGETERMIIRSQTLRLEVENTQESVEQVTAIARSHDGSVTDMRLSSEDDDYVYRYDEDGGDGSALRGWVTVRIPTDNFEPAIDELMALGEVQYQSEATEDVTQQHVDLSARLENLRAQEARLREFFDAAENVEEMLAIEQELGRVRGEIESLDAQITYLERQASMATVTIELTEPRALIEPEGEDWGFVDAIMQGLKSAVELTTSLITFVIATAPLWILGLIAFFVVRAIRRRRGPSAPPAGDGATAAKKSRWSGKNKDEVDRETVEDSGSPGVDEDI